MLFYNKSLDVNHTLLRVSSIVMQFDTKTIEVERLRIFDFIVSNPVHISQMSLGVDLIKERNKFRGYKNRYQKFDPKSLFETMRPIQEAVFATLKEFNVLIEIENSTRLRINSNALPEELISIAQNNSNSISIQAIDFIKTHLIDYELIGGRGLKSASRLMEYKYDAT